jgi:hypothetical protein
VREVRAIPGLKIKTWAAKKFGQEEEITVLTARRLAQAMAA